MTNWARSCVQTRPTGTTSAGLPLAGFYRVRQLRSHLEQVAHDPVVGDLEDRRFFVLVDGNDRLAGLHARAVLDRTGDAQRDVQLRRHGLAGLADLELTGVVAGIHRGARRAYRRAERVSQRLDHAEV